MPSDERQQGPGQVKPYIEPANPGLRAWEIRRRLHRRRVARRLGFYGFALATTVALSPMGPTLWPVPTSDVADVVQDRTDRDASVVANGRTPFPAVAPASVTTGALRTRAETTATQPVRALSITVPPSWDDGPHAAPTTAPRIIIDAAQPEREVERAWPEDAKPDTWALRAGGGESVKPKPKPDAVAPMTKEAKAKAKPAEKFNPFALDNEGSSRH